jgi:hypothetical protein
MAGTEERMRVENLLVRRENNAPWRKKMFPVETITHLLIVARKQVIRLSFRKKTRDFPAPPHDGCGFISFPAPPTRKQGRIDLKKTLFAVSVKIFFRPVMDVVILRSAARTTAFPLPFLSL